VIGVVPLQNGESLHSWVTLTPSPRIREDDTHPTDTALGLGSPKALVWSDWRNSRSCHLANDSSSSCLLLTLPSTVMFACFYAYLTTLDQFHTLNSREWRAIRPTNWQGSSCLFQVFISCIPFDLNVQPIATILHCPDNHTSFKFRMGRSAVSAQSQGYFFKIYYRWKFLKWKLFNPTINPKIDDHPLSAVHDYLFNISAATLHISRPSPPSTTWGRAVPWWQVDTLNVDNILKEMPHYILKAEAKATLIFCIQCSGALAGPACRAPHGSIGGTMKDRQKSRIHEAKLPTAVPLCLPQIPRGFPGDRIPVVRCLEITGSPTGYFHGLPQSFKLNARILPSNKCEHILLNPYLFIIHCRLPSQ
jgi:hypothetical protein